MRKTRHEEKRMDSEQNHMGRSSKERSGAQTESTRRMNRSRIAEQNAETTFRFMAARLRSIFVLRKLSLKTLQRFRWSFPLLFLLLAAVNFNSLTAPPFWDDLIGVQTQSVFLARCRLDVSALFSSPREAGSACYNPISILSWFYAILYLLLPPAAVHSAGHLLNCACLAGAGGLFWN